MLYPKNSRRCFKHDGNCCSTRNRKNAQVKGYSIGGKTGTSEDGVNTNKYVTSFIGTASISDPEVVILITLYNPTGEGGHQGGAWFIFVLHIAKTNMVII